jgi:hypothetical protein
MTLCDDSLHADAPPPPPRLLRDICIDAWKTGRTRLQEQPELHHVLVSTYGDPYQDYWEFWVVRGPNHTFLQRTMRNYHVERETLMRE